MIGTKFINFIAAKATCRILNKVRDAKVLEDETYGDMMEDLSEAWRKTDGPADPSSDDEYWVHTLKTSFQLMEALGLSKPVQEPPKRKPGRTKKNASAS